VSLIQRRVCLDVCLSVCLSHAGIAGKRGVQPKCVVQTGKRRVQNLEMWSPNSQCIFALGVQCRPLYYVNLLWLPFTTFSISVYTVMCKQLRKSILKIQNKVNAIICSYPVNLTTSTWHRAAVDFSGVTSDIRLLRRADDYLMLNHSVTPVLCSLIAACAEVAELSFRFVCRVANWHCKMPNK